MTSRQRFLRFNAVGALGIVVQLGVVWSVANLTRANDLLATVVAVAVAVVSNFLWHRRWTWGDRAADGSIGATGTFVRFALGNGVISLAGNVLVMALVMTSSQLGPVGANGIAIAICGLFNYWIGDHLVFTRRSAET